MTTANGAGCNKEKIGLLKQRYMGIASFQQFHSDDMAVLSGALEGTDNASDTAAEDLHPLYQKYLDLALTEQNTLFDEINEFIEEIKNIP